MFMDSTMSCTTSDTTLKPFCHLAAPAVHWMMTGDWVSSAAVRMERVHSRSLVLNAAIP